MRSPPDSNVRYFIHERPDCRTLVFMAIPATGNSFRRHSLGKFHPNQYVKEIGLNRKDYDLITFTRDPVQRFISVWSWMKKRRLGTGLNFMNDDPYKIDKHLRPQHTFPNVFGADYIGRFETLEKDWEDLRDKYLLGPFKKPSRLYGTKKWNEILTTEELLKVVNFYSTDFTAFGYSSKQYFDAIHSDANRLLRENQPEVIF